tara:strand:- start:366 stop:1307 length:942 start_codon:yes stop_codon:yes gene_type:complete
MPEAAVTDKFTTVDRIEDGSLRITFPEAKLDKSYEDRARLLVGDMIRRCFTVNEYTQCDFEVCMGDTIPYEGKNARQTKPQPGTHAIPFVLPAIGTVEAIRCGLKPICNGSVSQDMLDAFIECFESGAPRTPKTDPRLSAKPVPIVFDTDELQAFFGACIEEVGRLGRQVTYLSDAAYVRIYQSINTYASKEDAERFVQALTERGYLVSAQTRLREYMFGSLANQLIDAMQPAVDSVDTLQTSNEVLAQAVLVKQRLERQIQEANERAEKAEAKRDVLAVRVADLEAQARKQPDFRAEVQAGVQAELQRLLSS